MNYPSTIDVSGNFKCNNVNVNGIGTMKKLNWNGNNTYMECLAGSTNDMVYFNSLGKHIFYGNMNTTGNLNVNNITTATAYYFPNGEIGQNSINNDFNYTIFTDSVHRFYTANGAGGNIMTIDNGSVTVYRAFNPSDDRIKKNESLIENATSTLMKLRPEIYDKYNNLDCSGNFFRESGLIVQETYYNCPELRHLIKIPKDAHDLTDFVPNSIDPNQDPVEYSEKWGTEIAAINYIGLIPYLIKSIQELNETINQLKDRINQLENK
jgi:hypothetical protein